MIDSRRIVQSTWLKQKLAVLDDRQLPPDIFVFPGAFSAGLLLSSYLHLPMSCIFFIIGNVVFSYGSTFLQLYRVYKVLFTLSRKRI